VSKEYRETWAPGPGIELSRLPKIISDKIKIEPNSGCWIWYGHYYGSTQLRPGWKIYNPETQRAVWCPVTRMLYEMYMSGIPEKLELDHLCFVPQCVNPAHLEPVTHAENMRRYFANKFKHATHCKNGHSFAEVGFYSYPTKRGWLQRQCKACCGDRQRKYLKVHPR